MSNVVCGQTISLYGSGDYWHYFKDNYKEKTLNKILKYYILFPLHFEIWFLSITYWVEGPPCALDQDKWPVCPPLSSSLQSTVLSTWRTPLVDTPPAPPDALCMFCGVVLSVMGQKDKCVWELYNTLCPQTCCCTKGDYDLSLPSCHRWHNYELW